MTEFAIPAKAQKQIADDRARNPHKAAYDRDVAEDRVWLATDPDVKADAWRALNAAAARLVTLTADDVWDEMVLRPDEPRMLGPLMMRGKREQLIKPTETFVNSEVPLNHRRPQRVWRSLIHGGDVNASIVSGEGNPASGRGPASPPLYRQKRGGSGFVCGECRAPVDFSLNGDHDPACSNNKHEEE